MIFYWSSHPLEIWSSLDFIISYGRLPGAMKSSQSEFWAMKSSSQKVVALKGGHPPPPPPPPRKKKADSYGCFQKSGCLHPQNGWFISWKTLSKWMIWGYHHFWKHPYIDFLVKGTCLGCFMGVCWGSSILRHRRWESSPTSPNVQTWESWPLWSAVTSWCFNDILWYVLNIY